MGGILAKEIRDDELHRLIETMFEPFDYTLTSYQGNAAEDRPLVQRAAFACGLWPPRALLQGGAPLDRKSHQSWFAKEIRDDELHRLIETMFEPFDYTLTSYQGNAAEINPRYGRNSFRGIALVASQGVVERFEHCFNQTIRSALGGQSPQAKAAR
jgi:hypothetical protein